MAEASRRRILILGNYPPPYGGVQHHIDRLTQHLCGNGWDCHVLAGGTLGTSRRGPLTVSKPTWREKGLGAMATSFRPALWAWAAESSVWRTDPRTALRHRMYLYSGDRLLRRKRFDVIASYNLLAYSPIGDWLARRYGLPHIVNVFGEVYKSAAVRRDAAFFKSICDRAETVLSCSAHCATSLSLIGVERPARVVLYGVNIEHFRPGPVAEGLRALHSPDGDKVVLFVGRLGREMGLDSFIAAYQRVASQTVAARFIAIGQAAELVDEAKRVAEASGGRFSVVSNVPYDDILQYYRLADVVVVPTRGARTCSSLAAMEAMATAKPVVGFDVGGIPEVVQHERTGLLADAENVDSLARGILRILHDDSLAAAFSAAGFERATQHFDESRVGRTMEDIFLHAMANR